MKKFLGSVLAVIIGNLFTFFFIVLVIIVFGVLSTVGSWFQGSGIKADSVLELTFENPIKESTMDESYNLFDLSVDEDVYFRNIIRSIKAAKDDDKIKGISLKTAALSAGTSQISDLRVALEDFKSSGKFIYAYSHNTGQGAYLLNSVADSIFQNPMGGITLQGLSSEVMFFKNLGDKYGIDFQVIRHGAYKSAVEPYLRDDLSEENREQLTLLLNDIWENFSSDMAKSRNIPIDTFNSLVDSLVGFSPEKALSGKLVDKIAHEAEYDEAVFNRLGLSKSEKENNQKVLKKHTVGVNEYAQTLPAETGKDQIAILYASGAIASGDGFTGIQSEVYKKTIKDIRDNDKIKAVVLRINSPGGSADASEEILYELRELRKVKPLIVSFGDVAASGGYYIAMESDSIFASPNTITGSIGVLGMIPNFKKLANNIGITTDYVKTNENSDFLNSIINPLSDTGKETLVEMIESTYNIFVNHVANGRNMTFEEVDAVGGGRVWTGKQALKLGLVDGFGSLDDAIEAAVYKAGLDKYSIKNFPIRDTSLMGILKESGLEAKSSDVMIQQELGPEYYKVYSAIKSMKDYNGIQLRMPFEIIIK